MRLQNERSLKALFLPQNSTYLLVVDVVVLCVCVCAEYYDFVVVVVYNVQCRELLTFYPVYRYIRLSSSSSSSSSSNLVFYAQSTIAVISGRIVVVVVLCRNYNVPVYCN